VPYVTPAREAIDQHPYAELLTAGRKSLGSCQLGDSMEARPKQFRQHFRPRALPLKQREELGKREMQFGRRRRVIERHSQTERNIASYRAGEDAANSKYAVATAST
jgi:hypothetical protein